MAAKPKVTVPLERFVQARVVAVLRSCGAVVRSTSQSRASKVSEGIPDLIFHLPGVGGWFEVKRPRALVGFDWADHATWVPEPLRPEQLVFREDCLRANQPHYWGGVRELEAMLVEHGFGRWSRVGTDGHARGFVPHPISLKTLRHPSVTG